MATDWDINQNSGQLMVTKCKCENKQRWSSLNNVLYRSSNKFAPTQFDIEDDNLSILTEDFRILLVGADGLGCQILKNLALSAFNDIEVIDPDILDHSYFLSEKDAKFSYYEQQHGLNIYRNTQTRYFIFKYKHVCQSKAKVAAQFIMKRVPECNIKWHQCRTTDLNKYFYAKFNLVICASDDIKDRRFLNATLCDLVEKDNDGTIDPDSIIPLIICCTEQYLGQIDLYIPFMTACYECSNKYKSYKDVPTVPIDIRMTVKRCILFVKNRMWPRLKWLRTATEYEMVPFLEDNGVIICGYIRDNIHMEEMMIPMDVINVIHLFYYDQYEDIRDGNGVILDLCNFEHIHWIYDRSIERANKFNVDGMAFHLIKNIIKNIVPKMIATDALIAGLCVNEAFKILTWCSWSLNSKFTYIGTHGIYSKVHSTKKNPNCFVCGTESIVYKLDPNTSFGVFYKNILDDKLLHLSSNPGPTIYTEGGKRLYSHSQRKMYDFNIKISQLIENGSILKIIDTPNFGEQYINIKVIFE